MSKQYTVEVRMDYLLRMMVAVASERKWHEVEAILISANMALDRQCKELNRRKRAKRAGGSETPK